ncbi:MAG: Acylphosphatase [Gemmatimonadetes bacterium]|nr:Acylphosphatase [Gemmatimonadota bacterium]
MSARLRLRVHGRVQGVGFRWFVREQARALGLSGWVRNNEDGSVELEVSGADAHVAELEARVRQGPDSAHVAGVIVLPVHDQAPPLGDGFHVQH